MANAQSENQFTLSEPVSRSISDMLHCYNYIQPIRCQVFVGDNIVNVDFVKKTTVKVNQNGSTFAMAPIAHTDAG